MSDRHERDQALQQRISRAVLTDPDAAKRYHTDAATHLQVQALRNVLLLADKAMEAEGVDRKIRDRVVHCILVGEPPPGWEEDPDAELDEAVREQMATRAAWVQHLKGLPQEPIVIDYATSHPLRPLAPDAPELTEEQKQAAVEAANAQIEQLRQRWDTGVLGYDYVPPPAPVPPPFEPMRNLLADGPRTWNHPAGG